MGKKVHEWVLHALGIILILFGLLSFFNAFFYQWYPQIFWLCYVGLILMGLGVLLRNSLLLQSQLYLFALPDFIWSLDFFAILFSGQSLFGIADYVFLSGPLFPKFVTLQHLFAIPLVLYVLISYHEFKDRSWFLSFFQLTLAFALTRFFTAPESNVNCAFRPCGNFTLEFFYPLWWFTISFAMVLLTRWLYLSIMKKVIKVRGNARWR